MYIQIKKNQTKIPDKGKFNLRQLRGETDKKQAGCNSIWHMETDRTFLEGSVRNQQC